MAWNGSNSGEAVSSPLHGGKDASVLKRRGRRFPFRGAVAGFVVVLGAAVACWWCVLPVEREVTRPSERTEPAFIREATPAAAAKSAETAAVATVVAAPKKRTIPRKPDGSVDWTKIKPHELPPEMIASDAPAPEQPPPVFSNSADRIIAAVISTPPGQEMPPIVGLGDDLEVQFFKSLETPVAVSEDDAPEIRALKENLIATKRQILELIDAGKTVTQILQEHRETFNENRKDYADNQAIVNQLFEEGDVEGARAYVEKANRVLEKFGVPLLQMPKTREERIAEKRARREAGLRAEQNQ